MPFEKDPNEIGALWQHDGKKGPWMSGEINGQKVVVFATNATNSKAPAWRVLKSKPKDAEGEPRPMHNANATPDSDIPF